MYLIMELTFFSIEEDFTVRVISSELSKVEQSDGHCQMVRGFGHQFEELFYQTEILFFETENVFSPELFRVTWAPAETLRLDFFLILLEVGVHLQWLEISFSKGI